MKDIKGFGDIEIDYNETVKQRLPEFINACKAEEGDVIIMTDVAFGNTIEELILFGCAIKCATAGGKQVHVIPQKEPKEKTK